MGDIYTMKQLVAVYVYYFISPLVLYVCVLVGQWGWFVNFKFPRGGCLNLKKAVAEIATVEFYLQHYGIWKVILI